MTAENSTGAWQPGSGDSTAESNTHRTEEAAGTVIAGRYKLVELLGAGGMGSVWLAQQSEPVKRQVAVKLIKSGMDSKQVLARFEAERQALAVMDHPNIAKILDGGVTERGAPFFVMELVKGVTITQYCDDHRLTPRQRLELFVPVCQAIQHAHQKGIIHRDIKPSNVMVADYDDKPVPKVIDFGVAKATGQALTEQTLNTGFGGIVGTPEYMSPEQASLNTLDIDTRTDIYSLGVLLYELLAGSPPFKRKELEQAGLLEILRIIREVDPPKPSTKLSSAEALPSLSANRGTEPKRLTGLLRNELDWIVMKALEKDRARRYETANGFAADIGRYLAGEPVNAHPPSAGYRMQKFVRRNKGPVAASALLVFALLAGIGGTTWGMVRAERARQRESERAEGERLAKQQAQIEKTNAETREGETKAVLEFVQEHIISAARPEGQDGGLGRDVPLRRALEAALPFVERNFADQPLIEARVLGTLGTSFSFLGEHATAMEQYRRARDRYAVALGADDPETLRSMGNLASSYSDLGRDQDAVILWEETLKLMKAKLGTDHPDTLAAMNNLAGSCYALGRHQEALALTEESLKLVKAKLGADHPNTLGNMTNLAGVYYAMGRHQDALALWDETLKLTKARLGADHPNTLANMHNLALIYSALGRHQEALALNEETLKLRKTKLGADHPWTLTTMNSLTDSYSALGRHQEALALSEETLKLQKAKLGADHPDTLSGMNILANCYTALGRHQEARALREETLKLQKAKLGADHPGTLSSMNNLALTYSDLGRHQEALGLREETLKLRKAKLGADHPDTLKSMYELAASYTKLGRHQEALALREETLKLRKTKLGADHPDTLATIYAIACSHALLVAKSENPSRQADQAMDWLKQAVAAGYKDAANLKADKNIDGLRNRDDFKKLLADLEAAEPTAPGK